MLSIVLFSCFVKSVLAFDFVHFFNRAMSQRHHSKNEQFLSEVERFKDLVI